MPQLSYGNPSVADLEHQRKMTREQIRRIDRLTVAATVISLLVSLSLFYYYADERPPLNRYWIIPLATVGGIVIFWGLYRFFRALAFQRAYALKVLPLLVKEEWPDAEFHPTYFLPEEALLAAGILREAPGRYGGARLFSGLYAGLALKMSEVIAEREVKVRDEKGNTSTGYETVFSGIVLVAERYGHPGFSRISFRNQNWDITRELSGYFMGMASQPEIQIGTNDPKLGKLFEIHSAEPQAARALVTEELLVTLKKLKDYGKGGAPPEVVLTPTHLYISLPGEDFSLTPSLDKPIHQQATNGAQRKEFQLLLRLVALLAEEPG